MVDDLVKGFSGSGEFNQLVAQLQQQGVPADKAPGAVSATVEAAARAFRGGGLADALGGGGGLAGALGGMLGGGGRTGGTGTTGTTGTGITGTGTTGTGTTGTGTTGPAMGGAFGGMGGGFGGIADAVVKTVCERTGLSPDLARKAVNLALPKVMAYVQARS